MTMHDLRSKVTVIDKFPLGLYKLFFLSPLPDLAPALQFILNSASNVRTSHIQVSKGSPDPLL